MVKININWKNEDITKVQMSGHANSGEYGQDLVCAAFTGIMSGAMNAMDVFHKNDIDIKVLENEIVINVLNTNNQDLQTMLLMLKVQLETIAVQYPNNAKLKEVR
ncbi:ribosomal-processing cysteine protease Prp [Mesoplasma photuris]|uniref:ribosomal-processing cysteine protease Prp n=1 Tax=Mesoplasma photuris TaxID=217731 RepID=UPI0004E27FC5|nr:ribosomal-processing cysteine protease Prp [Mesoplasma photuris]